jgi:TatD DNase family protein
MTNGLKFRRLIDAHCHLDEIHCVDASLEKAFGAGVTGIVAVGMDIGSNRQILELGRAYPQRVYPAIGYHPWRIQEEQMAETLAFIDTHLPGCVALGEVGLDYRVKVKKPLQWRVFSEVLKLAVTHKKPVIVHCRFSHARSLSMVREAGVKKAVFHWYSGPESVLDEILDSGYHVSATPALAYSPYHIAAISRCPIERILIETDAPTVFQGKGSEPATLLETLSSLARLKGLPIEKTAEITSTNAAMFYAIADCTGDQKS